MPAPIQPLPEPAARAPGAAKAAPAPRPFLKWAGGKTQLLPEIRRRLPADWDAGTYHEPFVGGGAVFFFLQPPRARLADANAELINAYQVVRDDVERLIDALKPLSGKTDADSYYRIRDDVPQGQSEVARAARLIYLNKTCYNGLYRVNRAGKFNVPHGRYRNPTVCDPANLRACSAALRAAEILVAPFERVLDFATAKDFVYFDPPYDPVSPTSSFTAYYQEGFDEEMQARLAEVFAELDRRGSRSLLSNSDTPLIQRLYHRFRIDAVLARRAINSDPDQRGTISEVLVHNYPIPAERIVARDDSVSTNGSALNGRLSGRRSRTAKTEAAYEMLLAAAGTEAVLTVESMLRTGLQSGSIGTYLSKQWKDLIIRVEGGFKVKSEFKRMSRARFIELCSQKRRVYSEYERVRYDRVITYEFLLPLTREGELRNALDDLFFADTLRQRLSEISIRKLSEVVPQLASETDGRYIDRLLEFISNHFGGYSISHVSGRFRAAGLKTREEAFKHSLDTGRYLVDETTAAVRFIVPCGATKVAFGNDPSSVVAGRSVTTGENGSAAIDDEIQTIRILFLWIFAEAVVRVVQGEDQIWLIEDGPSRRLYVWERRP